MANRFDQPAQAQFINTYVPIPFEELAQAAQMRQGKHDENMARIDAAQEAVDNLVAIPNSKDEEYVNQVRSRISDLSAKYTDSDLSDSEEYRELRRQIRKVADPNVLNSIRQSYAGWQGHKQMEAQMRARGEGIYNPQDFKGYDSFTQGVYTGMPTMDLGAKAEDAINKFLTKPEAKYREVQLPSGRLGIEHYRDLNEINSLIDSESGELLNNPAIQQLMEKEGLNEEGFKEFLKNRAPSHVATKLSSVSADTTGGGGRETGFGFSPTPLSGLSGADVNNMDKRQVENNITDIEREIAQAERLGQDTTSLKNDHRELKRVIEEADKVGEPFYEEKTAPIKNTRKEAIKSFDFISGDLENKVLSVFDNFINKYKEENRTDVSSPMGAPILLYPGETEFLKELKEMGLKGREASQVLKEYKDFFNQKFEIRVDADNLKDEYIKENLSNTSQGRYAFSQVYSNEKGVLKYTDVNGDLQPSALVRILDNAGNDPTGYKLDLTPESTSPIKQRRLLDRFKEGKLTMNPKKATTNYVLGGADGRDIILNADLFAADKDGEPTGNKEASMKLHISDPIQMDAYMQELALAGDLESAYNISPIAWGIKERVKRAPYHENPTQVIELGGGHQVVVTNEKGNVYTVSFFNPDGSAWINPYTEKAEFSREQGRNNVATVVNQKAFGLHANTFLGVSWRSMQQ